jgi:hypothetical protein
VYYTSTIILTVSRSGVSTYIRALPITLRKGKCSCATQHTISQFVSTSSLSLSLSSFISHLSSASIPKTMQDALFDSSWGHAMELEMKALHQNGTWELVPLSPNKKTLLQIGLHG